jgi:hypothetical protein
LTMDNTDKLKRAEIEGNSVALNETTDDLAYMDTKLLFPPEAAAHLNDRWTQVQAAFVDDPQAALRHADELLSLAIRHLSQAFLDERSRLESQWIGHGTASTEQLRVALQHYRSFFHHLLHL